MFFSVFLSYSNEDFLNLIIVDFFCKKNDKKEYNSRYTVRFSFQSDLFQVRHIENLFWANYQGNT
jgi:hypothetical protein